MRRYQPLLMALLLVFALSCFSCGGGGPDGSQGEVVEAVEGAAELDNDFSFLVCGDPHGRTDLLAEIIGQLEEGEFLVVVGDITTSSGLADMERMRDFLDASGAAYHVIPGDNDMPGGDPSTFRAVFGPDYYSLDVQDAHLVFLDDAIQGVGCPEEELDWLREDLEGAGEKLVLAFAHVPPGAPVRLSGEAAGGRETESAREMAAILEEAGAPVIYCGHLHVYMLYSPGPPRVVVTGGAGAEPHLSEEAGGYHHFLRVTVSGDTVTEEIIRLDQR